MRQKRLRSEPVPELFPLTREELSENVFEILIDFFASPGSEHCEDSRVSAGSRVPEAHVHTQDRDRFRPLKRRVEVSMRDLSREDRDAFNRAKQKEWTSVLDKGAVELVKDRLKVPRSHILRARWVLTWKNVGTEKVPKARLCALGFPDPRLTTLPTSSPTLTSEGESAIMQWIINEGHLLESGNLKTAFLSGDPDPAHKGSDAPVVCHWNPAEHVCDSNGHDLSSLSAKPNQCRISAGGLCQCRHHLSGSRPQT